MISLRLRHENNGKKNPDYGTWFLLRCPRLLEHRAIDRRAATGRATAAAPLGQLAGGAATEKILKTPRPRSDRSVVQLASQKWRIRMECDAMRMLRILIGNALND